MADGTVDVITLVLGALLSAGFGGLATWMFKLDERVYILSTEVATRTEIDHRLDAIEKAVSEVSIYVKSRRNLIRRTDLHTDDDTLS